MLCTQVQQEADHHFLHRTLTMAAATLWRRCLLRAISPVVEVIHTKHQKKSNHEITEIMMQKVRRWETITPILPPHPLCQSICIMLLFDIQCTHFYNQEHCYHYLKRFLKRSRRQQCSPCYSRVERSTNTDFFFFFLFFILFYSAYFDRTIFLSLSRTRTHTCTHTHTPAHTHTHTHETLSLVCASECGLGACVLRVF